MTEWCTRRRLCGKLLAFLWVYGWALMCVALVGVAAGMFACDCRLDYLAGGFASVFTGVGLFASGQTTACRRLFRVCMAFLIVAGTLFFAAFTRNVHLEEYPHADRIVLILSALPAGICAGLTHPPSLYTRRAFNLVVLIWAANAARFNTEREHDFEFLGGWAANQQRFVHPVVLAYFIWHRLFALQEGFGKNLYVKTVLVFFALQALLNTLSGAEFLLIEAPEHLLSAWVGVCHGLAGVAYLLAGIAGIYAYSIPLRVLLAEVRHRNLNELDRREAAWAIHLLRMEMLGTLLTTSSTAIAHAVLAFDFRASNRPVVFMSNKLDALLNCYGTCLLSGAFTLTCNLAAKARPTSMMKAAAVRCGNALRGSNGESSKDPRWRAKVMDLATRGVYMEELLKFYAMMCKDEEAFCPQESTLHDVVAKFVIPLSRVGDGGKALASVWSNGEERQPGFMVTHVWSNVFTNLIAALVADALGGNTFADVADALIDGRVEEVLDEVKKVGCQQRTYWICAFCVNQHVTMCNYVSCPCSEPKAAQLSASESEVNKFDDMMRRMRHRSKSLEQIVAMDTRFSLVKRAWCVAELVQAHKCLIPQRLQIYSEESLRRHAFQMKEFDVRRCKATDPNDVDFILAKIKSKDAFNNQVKALLFSQRGLLAQWVEENRAAQQAGAVAARLERQSSRAGDVPNLSNSWQLAIEGSVVRRARVVTRGLLTAISPHRFGQPPASGSFGMGEPAQQDEASRAVGEARGEGSAEGDSLHGAAPCSMLGHPGVVRKVICV